MPLWVEESVSAANLVHRGVAELDKWGSRANVHTRTTRSLFATLPTGLNDSVENSTQLRGDRFGNHGTQADGRVLGSSFDRQDAAQLKRGGRSPSIEESERQPGQPSQGRREGSQQEVASRGYRRRKADVGIWVDMQIGADSMSAAFARE